VLGDFGVRGEIINARPGPVVTLYELEPAPGIKSSRVIGLADDIARSMSALSARVAVVSGRNAIGIELPNPTREKVFLRELLSADDYSETTAKLPLCLGKTIGGEGVIVDLARMPHLLIAGTTGSGKSVAINTMILSLLYRLRPEQCRLIMVDPKMLELSVYDGIPHLLTPVVTDPKKAVVALKWAVREMEERYKRCPSSACATSGLQRAHRRSERQRREAHPHRAHRLRQGLRRGDLRGRRARSRAAALHRRHRRRDGGPDDGRRERHRGCCAAPRADGACGRTACDPGHPAAFRRRHHRHH
jgi:S-DNA-T family DNA segregation ATPase FtsK/SpoIIIE